MAKVSRDFVEAYRELECFSSVSLDHVMAVVTRDKFHDTGRAAIDRMVPGRSDSVAVLASAFVAANHFYSAMTDWLGIEPGEHYICLDIEDGGADSDVDVRGVERTDGKAVDMVILHPRSNVIRNVKTGKREMDVPSIIKRIVWLMIYIDVHVHDKKPTRCNAGDDCIKGIIESSAGDVIKYAKEIAGSK